MLERILVPIDGSDDSWAALEQAIEIAQEEDGVIYGLFVADARMIEAPYWLADHPDATTTVVDPALTQTALQRGRLLSQIGLGYLEEFKSRCEKAAISSETEYAEGIVSNLILDHAQHSDLIVMGRRGEGATWAGPLLGSTIEAVIRHITVPVLIAQAKAQPVTRILVAYDGSARSEDALELATNLAMDKQRSIVLLTVDDGHSGREQAFAAANQFLQGHRITATPLLLAGHPTETILRIANEERCDLIALGAYGHSHFFETLFGSTVDEVIHHATCPVLVCH